MLYTNLKHIESSEDLDRIITENGNVVIICGRMDAASVKVYRLAEEINKQFPHIPFYDLEYDNPESSVLKNTLEYFDMVEIPIIGYFNRGFLVGFSFGIQEYNQIIQQLEVYFSVKAQV